MFTGIVAQTGRLRSADASGSGKRLVIAGLEVPNVEIGASVAVNGVCLTVVDRTDDSVGLEVVSETLSRTNLGDLEPGAHVNIEWAMPSSGRFDGHIVQGHVDGTGVVDSVAPGDDGGAVLTVSAPDGLLRYMVEKGSITIDGVSLTVVSVEESRFTVALIPHTLEVTNLSGLQPGRRVNLEVDVLAKYVERLLGATR